MLQYGRVAADCSSACVPVWLLATGYWQLATPLAACCAACHTSSALRLQLFGCSAARLAR
ncbi:hypothetical protein BIFGAL_04100 [Bifidobacterium gallicum DSM 20093 = LMG 11596]|uniref:Uncharacterized protein n=1 Tax=Bifidobacterium gallicum DSM 20093 = LMG 11596 TaxID=561180 RepID=D1NW54_9BIFI|nr:hypothetical protein BIFGAL_04100 [Bifidobacterium gallicum DSM 20093 = LMG 11596]